MSQQPQLVEAIIEGILEKKGRRIAVVDLNRIITAPAKYFVVCEANTPQQVQALTRSIGNTAIEQAGEKAAATIGTQASQWVAMDFGTVLVHIFLPELREFYDIENLWEDADITWLPEEN
ncbi:MAG: ribosome silencing factor [Bacteroidales bacterium]|nr:ribosome silencing factor [Bacteroidales bacterium]